MLELLLFILFSMQVFMTLLIIEIYYDVSDLIKQMEELIQVNLKMANVLKNISETNLNLALKKWREN